MRTKLLDAAETLIREKGYAAATARNVASQAGVKHQAVFYYFGSQDELLVEVFRRVATKQRERLEAALSSSTPLSSWWNVLSDPAETGFTLEFMALANHNEAIRAEIAANAAQVRALESQAIEKHLRERGIEAEIPPAIVSVLTNALARLLVQESVLGIEEGHEAARQRSDASFRAFEASGSGTDAMGPVVRAMQDEADSGPAVVRP